MADYFDTQPNFTNPAYASPEQLKAQRDYAAELMRRAGQGATRPAGVAAAMIDALTSNLTRSNADRLQSEAAQGNAADVSSLAAQLQRQAQTGQPLDPRTMGHLYANPMASPEARGFVGHLMAPQPITSPYGQPGYTSPNAGATAPQLPGNYTPGAPYSQSASPEGASQSGLSPPPGAPPPPPRPVPQAGQGHIFGGMSRPLGFNEGNIPVPAARPTAAPLAPLPGPDPTTGIVGNAAGGYQGPMSLDQLFQKGQKFATENEMRKAGSGAAAAFKAEDLKAANDAPALKTVLTTMLDDVQTHGQDWTMGPSADVSLKIKKLAANYAPGVMKDQLEKIASAESFSKMSATLSGMTPSSGNSDAQLVNRIESNPGLHNTVGGAAGILKMRIQLLDQQQKLADATAAAKTPEQYRAAKQAFFDDPANRIINPLTQHPIAVDLASSEKNAAGGYEKTAINPKTKQRIGLRNGNWEQIP